MQKILLTILVLLLSACNTGSELSGTYISTKNKNATVVFKPNNTLEVYNPSSKETMSAHFEIKDNTVSFLMGVPWKFVINADGSLTLNGVETFSKKAS